MPSASLNAREDLGAAACVFRERAAGQVVEGEKRAAEKFQVLLVGQRGAGKTALLGLLRGLEGVTATKLNTAQIAKLRREGGSTDSEARTVKAEMVEVSAGSGDGPSSYRVMDVPGWEDTSGLPQEGSQDEEHTKLFKKAAQDAKYIDAVVLVVNGTMARSQTSIEHSLQALGELYPIEEIRDKVVVLFTFCDSQQKCVYPIQSLMSYLGRHDPPLFYIDNPIGYLSGMTAQELEEQLVDESPDSVGEEIRRNVKKGAQAAAALLKHVSDTKEPTRLTAPPQAPIWEITFGLIAFTLFAMCYVLAPCNVENSNGLKGFSCACNDAYNGSISWEGFWRGGTCDPGVCDIENSNKQPGDACGCLHGYGGIIAWSEGVSSGVCGNAPCNIPHSNHMMGSACACANGYQGVITWNGSTPEGSCHEPPCRVANSNMHDGRSCACLDGFTGYSDSSNDATITGVIQWEGSIPTGVCRPAPCAVPHSSGENGWACGCDDGYNGTIGWSGSATSGTCVAASCHITNSNNQSGHACECMDGYTGNIGWSGPTASGTCTAAPCNIPNSTMEDGSSCECLDGYRGGITWSGSTPSGTCSAVSCNVAHSNMVPGPTCACLDGYEGRVEWSGTQVSGTCSKAPCDIEHSNQRSGSDCACLDGYTGDIEWSASTPSGTCSPARCNITHSNEMAGRSCGCSDGYSGNITWHLSTPSGACAAVPCVVDNSNRLAGTSCACLDGFAGHVAWSGPHSSGACSAAACSVDNSNSEPGPSCKCQPAYSGTITWSGSSPIGSCATCSVGYTNTAYFSTDCEPAACDIDNSNKQAGSACACNNGTAGEITWSATDSNDGSWVGSCALPAPPAFLAQHS